MDNNMISCTVCRLLSGNNHKMLFSHEKSIKVDNVYGAMKKSNSFKARKYKKKTFILILIFILIDSHRQQDVFIDSHS